MKVDLERCQIKICGIRDPKEAEALDALRVDWIGFNFHPKSPRYLTPEAAAPMVQNLKHAISVGVFVDLEVEEVIRIISVTGIRYVQLHGKENWAYINRMPVPVIKAIPSHRLSDLGGIANEYYRDQNRKSPLAYFLVDTQIKKQATILNSLNENDKNELSDFGGSGEAFDWKVLADFPLPLPFFLAGGLGPENLESALNACSITPPFAVDLNSKVEVSPGHKNLEKIKACQEILRARK